MNDLRVAIPGPQKGPEWLVQLTPPYSPSASPHAPIKPERLLLPKLESSYPSPTTPLPLPRGNCCQEHSGEEEEGSGLLSEACVGFRSLEKGFQVPSWAVGMTGREFELRMQLIQVQLLYREKQKELAQIKRSSRRRNKKPKVQVLVAAAPNVVTPRKRQASEGPMWDPNSPRTNSLSPSLLTPATPSPWKQSPLATRCLHPSPLTRECRLELAATPSKPESPPPPTLLPPPPPAPISRPDVRLSPERLSEGRRVMLLEGGLFYAGTLTVLDAEAGLFGVSVDGQRGARPHILCQEDLLTTAMSEVVAVEEGWVGPGARVAAFWSGQIRALYPGTVQSKSGKCGKDGEALAEIHFDDGDSGQIALRDIRLLPSDFPFTKVLTPVLPEFITRQRSSRGFSDPNVSSSLPSHLPSRKRHSYPRARDNSLSTDSEDWEWVGLGTANLKKKRVVYNAVRKGNAVFSVGDVVHLQTRGGMGACAPGSPSNSAYVGLIKGFWEPKGSKRTKRVTVAWLYRLGEVVLPDNVTIPHAKDALFTSSHVDENSVETISNRCTLLPFPDYKLRHKSKDRSGHLYFMAGSYDPVDQDLVWDPALLPHIH